IVPAIVPGPLSFLYVDAFSGVSGDMFLGALTDLGHPFSRLQADIAALGLDGIRLRRRRITRAGMAAVQVRVSCAADQPHRGRRELRRLLRQAALPPAVRRQALAVFERLIEVEARIHRILPEKVHLHEVGALDALADVVGTVAALQRLGVKEIRSSPVNVGSGTVACAHGTLPVPAPATAALLENVPIYGAGEGEKTTPTGAALLTTLATSFGPMPGAVITAIGHGAGQHEDAQRPNLLRLMGGDLTGQPVPTPNALVELACEIDDMDPRLFGHLFDVLLAAGARDVHTAVIQMKKQRPGTHVTVLARPQDVITLGTILLDETTTLGYRIRPVERVERVRRHVTVRTRYGPVRLKVSGDDLAATVATPEYEDCRRLARKKKVPLRAVLAAARAAAEQFLATAGNP
ncbi:MAG: nickel pincer cofactor biosynthesis protein LarC, partial [Acidobacteriota bacterium]